MSLLYWLFSVLCRLVLILCNSICPFWMLFPVLLESSVECSDLHLHLFVDPNINFLLNLHSIFFFYFYIHVGYWFWLFCWDFYLNFICRYKRTNFSILIMFFWWTVFFLLAPVAFNERCAAIQILFQCTSFLSYFSSCIFLSEATGHKATRQSLLSDWLSFLKWLRSFPFKALAMISGVSS